MTQRIVIAGMLHETNTFSPVPTPLAAFFSRARPPAANANPLIAGDEALALYERVNVGFGGFLKVARQAGAEVVAPLYANAAPSAPTSARDYDTMADAILAAVRGGCDAIMLDLHGAMVASPSMRAATSGSVRSIERKPSSIIAHIQSTACF